MILYGVNIFASYRITIDCQFSRMIWFLNQLIKLWWVQSTLAHDHFIILSKFWLNTLLQYRVANVQATFLFLTPGLLYWLFVNGEAHSELNFFCRLQGLRLLVHWWKSLSPELAWLDNRLEIYAFFLYLPKLVKTLS